VTILGLLAGALLSAGCAPADVAEALPTAATATGVEAEGDGWSAAAATLRFGAGIAEATEPAILRTTDGRPPMEILADRSDWDLRARAATFTGHVQVRRGEVTLRCEALDVRYAGAERIDRIVATGNVEVRRGERVATAASAELDGASGRITLTGAPQLSEGPNTLVGTTLVLWLDDERATCEGADGAPCRLVVAGSALR
jgi:lipopolysaccharide export system protein LptA